MRTAVAVALLAAAAVAGFGLGVLIRGTQAAVPAGLGLAITLPVAAVSLVLVTRVWQFRPDAGPVAVVAGTGLRMVWAMGVVFVLRGPAAELGTTPEAIANWTAALYVWTLAAETLLLWWLLADRPAREVTGDDPTPR